MKKRKISKKLSTVATIGKYLILVGIILQIIGIVIMTVAGSFMGAMIFSMMMFGGAVLTVILAVQVIGLILGVFAFKRTEENNFHDAGVYALIASFIPPLNVVMLIGAVLCLISKEAK